MITAWELIGVGAGLALLFILVVVGTVILVVHRHEVRELRVTTQQYTDLMDEMRSLKNLTLNAISGRAELEKDVADLKKRVEKIEKRMAFDFRGDAA